MNNNSRAITDILSMPNTEVINNLLFIASNLIDYEDEHSEEERDEDDNFYFEIWAMETASARILTLSKLAYFFGVGFFITNIFWLYNYLDLAK
jgi:predicted nucleic acid-binding protein